MTILWKILFFLANGAADLAWAIAKKSGSKAWGGAEGAYRLGRNLRDAEYRIWLPRYQAAVQSTSAGDLDDSAFELAKGHGRYEIEEYHVLEQLENASRKIDVAEYTEARTLLDATVRVLRTGRPSVPDVTQPSKVG